MNDLNENISIEEEPKKPKKRREKTWMKGMATALSGGIIGSLLTLAVVPQVDGLTDLLLKEDKPVSETAGNSSSSGAVTVQKTKSDSSGSVADIVEGASKAIVGIVNKQKQTQGREFPNTNTSGSDTVESGTGTGVVFKIDGDHAFIVTNNHVIEGAEKLEITVYGGEKTTAEVIGADALTDLAVLKIDAKYAVSALGFGDSSLLRAGDQVVAIGNPLGLDLSNTVTQGIVSAVDRTVSVSTSAGAWDLNVIQTDAAINPGNSGGALINTAGQVIGINSLKISEDDVEGLGFAIPSNDVVSIINEIIENGQVERPYIGVGLASLDEIPQQYVQNLPKNIEGGVMVTSVDPNSAAAKAGLQTQDVIVSINDHGVTTSNDLRKYLYNELKPGDTITLEIYRGDSKKTIKLTLTSTGSTLE